MQDEAATEDDDDDDGGDDIVSGCPKPGTEPNRTAVAGPSDIGAVEWSRFARWMRVLHRNGLMAFKAPGVVVKKKKRRKQDGSIARGKMDGFGCNPHHPPAGVLCLSSPLVHLPEIPVCCNSKPCTQHPASICHLHYPSFSLPLSLCYTHTNTPSFRVQARDFFFGISGTLGPQAGALEVGGPDRETIISTMEKGKREAGKREGGIIVSGSLRHFLTLTNEPWL